MGSKIDAISSVLNFIHDWLSSCWVVTGKLLYCYLVWLTILHNWLLIDNLWLLVNNWWLWLVNVDNLFFNDNFLLDIIVTIFFDSTDGCDDAYADADTNDYTNDNTSTTSFGWEWTLVSSAVI